MAHKKEKGAAALELGFISLILIPLLLGTATVGIDMILTLQTIQFARDVGPMAARGVDFSLPGNKSILANLGSNLKFSTTAGQGSAVLIVSKLTYVDKAACAALGLVDGAGEPTAGCTNYTHWVFMQRLVLGNSSVRTSNVGSPLTSGPTGVTVNSSTGAISQSDYVTHAGAVATFSGINPYAVVNGAAQGLPSGQVLYLAEASARGFTMAPWVRDGTTYAFGLF